MRVLDTVAGRFVVEATPRGIVGIDRVGADVVVGDEPDYYDDDGNADANGDANGNDDDNAPVESNVDSSEHLDLLAEHLDAYLAGTRRGIDVPLDLDTAGVHDEFAREVYREIQQIPYGETASYGQVSVDAGRPRNARRVGRLCSLVPAPFIIPVHRVIRADGGLGSCPEYRLQLLEHERRNLHAGRPVAFPRI